MTTSLDQFSKAVAAVVAAAAPSVVGVGRTGSGVVVGDGLIVTNAHNLRPEIVVFFEDGRALDAEIAGVDLEGDLAVLSADTGGSPCLAWAEDGPALGEVVVGLSRPGGKSLRAGAGFVSGTGLAFRGPGREHRDRGTGAQRAPRLGDPPGGPVVNANGQLVGINTHRKGDGFYLALPLSAGLKGRVESLARGEVPHRVRLGVALAPAGVARRLRQAVGLPHRDGLLVHAVEPDGAAARAGVRQGDLIVSVGGRPVSSLEDLGLGP